MTSSRPNTSPAPARAPVWRDLRRPADLLALGFGSGLAPKAPGTVGTVAAVPLYLLIAPLPLPLYLALLAALFLLGVVVCDRCARRLGVHDHPAIVFDEFVGYFVTMLLAPAGWVWLLWGFVLFRIFDIFKPWPIRFIDRRVAGGLGIMLDDVLAGGFAWALMQLSAWAVGA